MSFTWPQFPDPIALDAERAFTASFDSYDQRNDDCYYVITLRDHGREVRFMAQIALWWAGEDWTGPEFVERLRKEIAEVAAAGKANTSYRGSIR